MDGDPDLLRSDAASRRKWFATVGRKASPSSSRIEDPGDAASLPRRPKSSISPILKHHILHTDNFEECSAFICRVQECLTLKIEAHCSFELSVTVDQSAWRNVSEDFILHYRCADKSLSRPGRNKATASSTFLCSYILFIIIIGGILILYIYITRLASNEIFSPSNKIHREVSRAKDLPAPW